MNKKEVVKDTRLQLRIESEHLEELKRRAAEAGLTLSEYVKRCVDIVDPYSTNALEDKEKAVEID